MVARNRMFCLMLLTLCIGLTSTATAADSEHAFTAQYLPTIEITRLAGEIKIDGKLDDSGWRTAAVADGFCENSPADQEKPPVESKALITYDETNLYVALIAYDDPSEIRASLRDRDEIFRDDYFGVLFDTYGDGGCGYELFVNPFGIQADMRLNASGEEDSSFDMIFASMGQVTDSGYQVELAIPFASLRFPDKPNQKWRVNFWRDHQREVRRKYSWAARDRDNNCFMCQWGYLEGIRDIKPTSCLEIMPNIIAYQSSQIYDGGDPHSGMDHGDPDGEASVNLKYGLSSNSSVEFTLNPDFSQVESDAAQVDVNTAFGLYYPESRPFFQEGSEIFGTWINAIYTRSINDPIAATKLTGQFGRTSVAFLTALDENTPLTIPMREQSTTAVVDKSVATVMRAQRTLGTNSRLGLTMTDRRVNDFDLDGANRPGGSNTVFGIDGRLWLSKQFRIEFQTLGSYSEEIDAPDLIDTTAEDGLAQIYIDGTDHTVALDGERFWGHANYLSLEWGNRTWYFDADYWENSPTFRTDNGYTNRVGYRTISFLADLTLRPNNGWLVYWGPNFSIGRSWKHESGINLAEFDDNAFDEWVRGNLLFRLKGQTDFSINYVNSQERFGGIVFPGISLVTINLSSRPSELISGGISHTEGRTIRRLRPRSFYDEDEAEMVNIEPELAYQNSFSCYLNIKPSQRLYISPSYDYYQLDHRDGWLRDNPGEEKNIYSGFIFRTRMTYQFTRELFLRLVVQYDDFSERLDIEPLLTYRVNPFTKFYIGMTSGYQYFDNTDYTDLDKSEWSLDSRQIFAKVQYLFRL